MSFCIVIFFKVCDIIVIEYLYWSEYMNIEELEKLRKKAKNIVVIGIVCSIIIGIILFSITKLFPTLFIGCVVGIIITLIISSGPSKKFALAFKETFVLNNTISDLLEENEELRKRCPHEFGEDGACIYCDLEVKEI